MHHTPYPRTAVRAAVFDPTQGRWVDDVPPSDASSTKRVSALSVATWNVWFGQIEREARARAMLSILEALRPDVVCLQEVLPSLLEHILATPWIRAGYRASDATGATLGEYGVVMLSRLPFQALYVQEIPTNMGRSLLFGDLALPGHPVRVGTVHLESTRFCQRERIEQLEVLQPVLLADGADVVLTGDLNFDPVRNLAEQRAIDACWRDAWTSQHAGNPGYTVDTEANAMRMAMEGEPKQRRYDRVLFHGPTPPWKVVNARLLGTAPIAPDKPRVFPSDHFGVFARFDLGTPP